MADEKYGLVTFMLDPNPETSRAGYFVYTPHGEDEFIYIAGVFTPEHSLDYTCLQFSAYSIVDLWLKLRSSLASISKFFNAEYQLPSAHESEEIYTSLMTGRDELKQQVSVAVQEQRLQVEHWGLF